MKGKILSLSALVVAAMFAFAFKAEPRKAFADQVFQLDPNSQAQKFDPLRYSEVDPESCPGASTNICAIDLFSSDVYTLAEATAAGNAAWAGHPKVNVPGSQLVTDLTTAAGSSTDNQIINGRTYFKRTNP